MSQRPPVSGQMRQETAAHVTILMGTQNGAAYLPDQLASFTAQDHENWSLWVSDDGSEDATLAVIEEFARAHPNRDIRILEGPKRGSAMNFLSLLGQPDLPDGLVAFADQDDIWMGHKLSRAVEQITKAHGPDPKAYACATVLSDDQMRPIGPSRVPARGGSFANALVQNVLGGNTIVLDPAAVALARASLPAALAEVGVPFHDWWIYLLMSGAGAQLIIDARAGLFYRQHGDNVLGANRGLRGGLARLAMVRRGHHRDWITRNLVALGAVADHLTPENRAQFEQFQALRQRRGIGALRGLCALGAHRQTRLGNVILWGQALRGRL